MIRAIVIGATLMVLAGCAHVISEESRRMVDPAITFGNLRDAADRYLGKQVMLGGIVATTRNTREGGELEVVQFDLDRYGVPQTHQGSAGRFLATSPLFLDPVVYQQGRLVTLVGEVKGKTTRPLDEVEYTYPTIAIREIRVVKSLEPDPYPLPSHYYDPYQYGYAPWPYPLRPIGPAIRP